VSLKLKLLCTDFDGTIHNDQERPPVPLALQELIQNLQQRGAKWIINTGRDLPSLLTALEQAQLHIEPDYLVVVEREVYYRDGTHYRSHAQWNDRCRQIHDAFFSGIKDRIPEIKTWILSRFKASVFEDAYSPFCMVAATNADADAIMVYLAGVCREVPGLDVMRNDVYARFSHADYHKGTAMAEIGRLEEVERDGIFAAGDHLNDLPMLSSDFAGCLMAPANAVAEVKQAVRHHRGYISRTSHGHGVREGLEFYLANHPA
jgi:HAD superfamily hydrolase (TIGR01484 family)